jgi:hypothetical protein
MVDYTRSTGSAGVMIIRDHGTSIEFLIRSNDSATFIGSPGASWSGQVNGQTIGGNIANYSNSETRSLGFWDITTTQDVRFSIGATGTQGLGGPTDFWQRIDRTPPVQVPGAPTNLRVTDECHTQMGISYNRGAENGGSILQDEATWYYPGGQVVWVDGNCNGYTNPNDGVAGPKLNLFTEYHIYIRSRNSAGWGPSSMIGVRTLASGWLKHEGTYRPYVKYMKIDGVYREIIPFVKDGGIYKPVRQ